MARDEAVALTGHKAVNAAILQLVGKLSKGSRKIPAITKGGIVYWHDKIKMWGYFHKGGRVSEGHGYWNVFGRRPFAFKSNIIVEINPPSVDLNGNAQGLIGRYKGKLLLLHQGRLHPKGVRVTEEMFDRVIKHRQRVAVRLDNGRVRQYHVVANLRDRAEQVQHDIGQFVADCESVRLKYMSKTRGRRDNRLPTEDELGVNPERSGTYFRPALPAKEVERRHANIWRSLSTVLKNKGIEYTNSRFENWGPDLLALTKPDVLFEIKSECFSGDIQTATGQLLIYENFIGRPCKKVVVLPEMPSAPVLKALTELSIVVLTFSCRGKSIIFDRKAVMSCFSG